MDSRAFFAEVKKKPRILKIRTKSYKCYDELFFTLLAYGKGDGMVTVDSNVHSW